MTSKLLVLFYKTLLGFYPRSYRLSFAAEMVEVFRQSVSDSARRGRYALWRVVLRELGDLPLAAAKEHFSVLAGRKAARAGSAHGPGAAVSRRELFVTLGAFAIPLALVTLNNTPAFLTAALPTALVFIGLVVIAGLIRGIPRWCLPYLGLALSIISFLVVFTWLADLILPTVPPWLGPGPREHSTRLLWQGLLTGMMWFSLFLLVLSVWLVLGFVRRLSYLKWSAHRDWTQVSFILYGGAMTALALLFNDYDSKETFVLASLMCLAAGAWFYLRSSLPWQRLLALLAGVTLALGVAAAGMWLKAPLQPWTWAGAWNTPETERWFEAWRAVLVWVWLVFFLLAPGMLRYIGYAGETRITGGGDEPSFG